MASALLHAESVLSEFNCFFVACFCQEADLLSQWRAYGQGGFALGFDLGWVTARERMDRRLGSPVRSGTVVYDEETQRSMVLAFLREAVAREDGVPGSAQFQSVPLMCRLKDKAFQEERELRLMTAFSWGQSEIQWRVADGLIIPYTELALPRHEGPEKGLLPIVDIVIGPMRHPEAAERSIRGLLEQVGYASVSIRRSEVPLRI